MPVEGMVPYLGGVIKNAAGRFFDDILQWHILELGARDQFIEIIDICFMVFAVMVLECFGAEMGRQRFFCKWQLGKLVNHDIPPQNMMIVIFITYKGHNQ
jgi:hypothetical protein